MVLILRRAGAARWADLGAAGVCRVGLADILGCWMARDGVGRVIWLGE